jgi:hypothetical protein
MTALGMTANAITEHGEHQRVLLCLHHRTLPCAAHTGVLDLKDSSIIPHCGAASTAAIQAPWDRTIAGTMVPPSRLHSKPAQAALRLSLPGAHDGN